MRNCLFGFALLVGSVAFGGDPDKPNEKPTVEVLESDSTTWRLSFQDPSEWAMPQNLSNVQQSRWKQVQQETTREQSKIEAESAKYPNRELPLKSGSIPKNSSEETLVLKFQKKKVDDLIKALKLKTQKTEDALDMQTDEIKARIRQLKLSPQRA